MDYQTANVLLYTQIEQDIEDKCWERWLNEQPEGLSFQQYKDQLLGTKDPKDIDFDAIRRRSKEIERRFKEDGAI